MLDGVPDLIDLAGPTFPIRHRHCRPPAGAHRQGEVFRCEHGGEWTFGPGAWGSSWSETLAPLHRHLFVLHRHPEWRGHPRPDRWHVHVWFRHDHRPAS